MAHKFMHSKCYDSEMGFCFLTGCPLESQLISCHSSIPPHTKDIEQKWKSVEKANKDEQSSGMDSLKVFLHLQFS